VDLRPTVDGDLPALHDIFLAAVAGVFEPQRFEPQRFEPRRFAPPAPRYEVFASLQGHIARTGHSVVATGENERIIGFASAWRRDGQWFLASLFVDPAAQGGGVGSTLLDAVWGEARGRRTITDAIQPVSNALYGRRGLVPATPVLGFSGRPRTAADTLTRPESTDVAAVDVAAYGSTAPSITFTGSSTPGERPGRTPTATRSWVEASAPWRAATQPSAAHALRTELARDEGEVRLRIPGSSRAVVEVALAGGLRLSPAPGPAPPLGLASAADGARDRRLCPPIGSLGLQRPRAARGFDRRPRSLTLLRCRQEPGS
jgi:GNAT superfamily N-acetyltransferase